MTELQQMSLFPPRTVEELVEDIERIKQEIKELYCLDDIPWIIGYSGGKDSGAVVQLVWYAVAELPVEKRHKKIYIITTDTLVENPIVAAWVRKSLERMKASAKAQTLPIDPHLLYPDIKDTFWVSLIGKGYPSPRHRFRWCTERLKIQPSNQFVRDVVRTHGEVVLVLGTRKAESTKRAASMEKHKLGQLSDRIKTASSIKSILYQSPSLPNALVYSPIQNWRTEEVWIYLNQWPNPWEQSNKELFTMYRGATSDSECPLVLDTSTPSCGSSRFGCWVCTMVNQDKSMEAMIQNDEEKEWMQPLLDIRNELDVEDDYDRRDFRRIWGQVQLFERSGEEKNSVEPIPGPYTKYWREHWLRRVLEAQTQIRQTAPPDMRDITLITPEELSEIRRIWLEEKHEFDDSLPRIYQEVTGEPFKDIRPGVDRTLLGSDEWTVLAEICEDDDMHLELMAKLLDTERQYYTKTRRTGIYNDLEKCFESSSRDKEDAIDNAHYQRKVKNAVQAIKDNPDDIYEVRKAFAGENTEEAVENAKQPLENKTEKNRQLSWADLKFSASEEETEED